jgi:c(7)-type cytochrome triheme protein
MTPRWDRNDPAANAIVMDLNIVREVKGSMPDVVYPHKQHTEWLDCSNCHPAIFVPQKGANQISMASILLGQKCGVCHGKVAFPVSECRLCHSRKKAAPPRRGQAVNLPGRADRRPRWPRAGQHPRRRGRRRCRRTAAARAAPEADRLDDVRQRHRAAHHQQRQSARRRAARRRPRAPRAGRRAARQGRPDAGARVPPTTPSSTSARRAAWCPTHRRGRTPRSSARSRCWPAWSG